MAHDLDVISSALIHLLVIGAILAVPVVLVLAWRVGRRRQLVVAELVNSTGHSELDETTHGLTQFARQRIDVELPVVSERRKLLSGALNRTTRVPADSEEPPRVQPRLDDHLDQLLIATREVTPEKAQAAVQFITVLVSRPHGLLVSGILQSRGTAGSRWGVSFDVLRLDTNRSVESHTFWEPTAPLPNDPETGQEQPATSTETGQEQPATSTETGQEQPGSHAADAGPAHEHIRDVLRPAGRWLAIQLVINSVFPGGARGREKGLDWLLSGMLYYQSSSAYPGYGHIFHRLALKDLRKAAEEMDKVPIRRAALDKVPYYLAVLADFFDQLAASTIYAAAPDVDNTAEVKEIYQHAHEQYARALSAMARSRKVPDTVVRRYRVLEAISWLASELPKAQHEAFRWLDEGGPDLTRLLLAEDLYDAACLYALAAQAGRHTLREQAAQLLMQALQLDADTPDRKLWAVAENDLKLAELPVQKLVEALEGALASAYPVTRLPRKQLQRIVNQVLPCYRE